MCPPSLSITSNIAPATGFPHVGLQIKRTHTAARRAAGAGVIDAAKKRVSSRRPTPG